jgi:hypothetical protein
LHFSLKSESKKQDEEKEEFDRDPEVNQIPAKAGLNRFVWDLRYEPPAKIPAAIYDNGEPAGPLALPGKFQARLSVAGKSYTAPLEVRMDPRVGASAEDLHKQFDFLLKLRDREEEMNATILKIRDLQKQLDALKKRLGASEATKEVRASAEVLRKKITGIEEALIQVNATAQEDEANYPTKLNSKLGLFYGGRGQCRHGADGGRGGGVPRLGPAAGDAINELAGSSVERFSCAE